MVKKEKDLQKKVNRFERAKEINTLRKLRKGIKKDLSKGIKRKSKYKDSLKKVQKRAAGTSNILKAFGVVQGTASSAGRGRPYGSYKYGMPIHEYKKLQSRKSAMYSQYQNESAMRLQNKGFNPEQIERLQQIQTITQARNLNPLPINNSKHITMQEVEQMPSVPDDELQFRKFLAKRTLSPNTQNMLNNLRRTQLKSERDDVEMQRRINERKIVASAGSLLKTPYIFNRYQFNSTGVEEDNILLAPNTFKEIPGNRIMKTNRPNILQTKEGGNDLGFI